MSNGAFFISSAWKEQLLGKGKDTLGWKTYKCSQLCSKFASTQRDIFFRTHLYQLRPPGLSPALRLRSQSEIMHNIIPVICLATASFTAAHLSFPLTERAIGQSCSISGESGTCQKTSDCATQGYNKAGYCPGAADIQCCVKKTCSTGSGSGICMNTENTCDGSFIAGACPDDSTVKVSQLTSYTQILRFAS